MELQINLDCSDLERMVAFYTAAFGYERKGTAGSTYASAVPPGGDRPKLVFQRVPEPKAVKNRMHLDVIVDDIDAEAERYVALGATRVEKISEYGCTWIVMLDPEGNELCLCDS
jgi:predicted enzyme related to lactoylglutathione lyase